MFRLILLTIFANFINFNHATSSRQLVISKSENNYKVAFVFAGSARSFLSPLVRNTIKVNLLTAFCPPLECDHDIFVRMSSSDNFHQGYDAAGFFKPVDANARQRIVDAMEDIEPRKENGNLYLEFVDIGSALEKKQMEDYEKGRFVYRMYRELDSRRYSMYFHRWKAYEMVINHERMNGFKYDWVVHARLDTAWGEPIAPVFSWSPTKIYVPDTWYLDVPDTFALLPRDLAEPYYSLDLLMERGHMCLGGPNFNTRTIYPDALIEKGYTEEERRIIHDNDCLTVFGTTYPVVEEKKNTPQAFSWTMGGCSEYFLKRKLKKKGISYDLGTLGFSPFFVFIVRAPLDFVCHLIHVGHFIPWAKTTQTANAAILPACMMMSHTFHDIATKGSICELFNPNEYSTQMKLHSSLPTHPMGSCLLIQNNHQKQSQPQQQQEDHQSLVSSSSSTFSSSSSSSSSSSLSDMNFMPYRMRFKQSTCIHTGDKILGSMNTTSCINYERKKFLNQYSELQLFYFFPQAKKIPQRIFQWMDNVERRCLTIQTKTPLSLKTLKKEEEKLSLFSSFTQHHQQQYAYPVLMQVCDMLSTNYPKEQMFVIDQLLDDNNNDNKNNHNKNNMNEDNNKRIIDTNMINIDSPNSIHDTNPFLPQTSIFQPIVIRWDPTGEGDFSEANQMNLYCLFLQPILHFKPCHLNNNNNNNGGGQVILLERTRGMGPPYKPGITIGKFPTWGDP